MITSILISVGISLAVTLIGAAVKGAAQAATAASAAAIINNIFSIANLSNWGGFDAPSNAMILQATGMLINFMFYAQDLVMICAFLCIVFNAFKLWAGTIEVKKVFVETVYKATMCIAVMLIYPVVVTKVLDISTTLGVEASGGYDAVMTSFANMATKTKEIWNSGSQEFVKILKEGGEKDENGNTIISENLLKTFTNAGLTEAEAQQWASQNGLTIGETSASGIFLWKNNQKKTEQAAKKSLTNEQTLKKMKQSMAIVRGMSELLTGVSEENIQNENGQLSAFDLMNMGDETINKIFYNPYIDNTKRLSTSAMIKTAIVISSIASDGSLASITETFSEKENPSMAEVTKTTNGFIKFLAGLFKGFVYKMSMVIAMIFIMCEYVICVIEYLIVAAVSALFIPLLFIDATKNYATNILKTLLAYFTKILVTTMMCFFTVSMYIELGAEFCAKTDLSSISTVIVYIFTIILGLFLVKNSGKIAGAVISGNPSMGLGDVANEMRSATHAMHMMGHMNDKMSQGLSKGIQGAGDAVATGYGNYKTGKAASQNVQSRLKEKANGEFGSDSNSEYSGNKFNAGFAGWKAKVGTIASAQRQQFGDMLFNKFTGDEKGHFDEEGKNNGFLRNGQKFVDKNGRQRNATLTDIIEQGNSSEKANKSIEKQFNKQMEKHARKSDHDILNQNSNLPEIEG